MHDIASSIFRKAAVDHYLSTDDQGQIVRVEKPMRWLPAIIVAAAIGAVLLLAILYTSVGSGPAWHELF